MPRARLAAVLLALVLAFLSLGLAPAPEAYEKLRKDCGIKPYDQPIDLVYAPVFQKKTMVTRAVSDKGANESSFDMILDTRPNSAGDGNLASIETTTRMVVRGQELRSDEPLVVLAVTLTPKGKVLRHELAMPGLESAPPSPAKDVALIAMRSMEANLDSIALPADPVACGETIATLPTQMYLGAFNAAKISGPEGIELRVDGRGVLDGREVLAASGRGRLSFTIPQSGPQTFDMDIFMFRLYDLKSMALVRMGSSTRLTSQGRTLEQTTDLVTTEIR